LDAKRQKPLIFQWLVSILWTVLDVLESRNGGRSRIRTYDFHRVKVLREWPDDDSKVLISRHGR